MSQAEMWQFINLAHRGINKHIFVLIYGYKLVGVMPYKNLADRHINQLSSPSDAVRICFILEVIRLVSIEVNGVIRSENCNKKYFIHTSSTVAVLQYLCGTVTISFIFWCGRVKRKITHGSYPWNSKFDSCDPQFVWLHRH